MERKIMVCDLEVYYEVIGWIDDVSGYWNDVNVRVVLNKRVVFEGVVVLNGEDLVNDLERFVLKRSVK